MSEEGKKYLTDILHAISLIDDFTGSINDFSAYQADLKTQSAVERQLGIIGEAINKLEKVEHTFKLSQARQIVGLRNRLIHTYDNLDETIIWAVLKQHLPVLRQEAETGLKK